MGEYVATVATVRDPPTALHCLTTQLSRSSFDEIVKSMSQRRTVDPAAPSSTENWREESRSLPPALGLAPAAGGSSGTGSGSVVMDTLFRWLDADCSNALSKSEVAALLPLLQQV